MHSFELHNGVFSLIFHPNHLLYDKISLDIQDHKNARKLVLKKTQKKKLEINPRFYNVIFKIISHEK
jgi:hypothetical protein